MIVSKGLLFPYTENKIDGESFRELYEADVKEMVKPVGVVKKIMKFQSKCKVAVVRVYYCLSVVYTFLLVLYLPYISIAAH